MNNKLSLIDRALVYILCICALILMHINILKVSQNRQFIEQKAKERDADMKQIKDTLSRIEKAQQGN